MIGAVCNNTGKKSRFFIFIKVVEETKGIFRKDQERHSRVSLSETSLFLVLDEKISAKCYKK